jgi:hypothetical protein
MDKSKLIELIYASLPHSNRITGVDLSQDHAVEFAWNGHRLRVTEALSCTEAEGDTERFSDLSLLVETLIRREWEKKGAA